MLNKLPKPLLFALIASIGGLIAALFGESFLKAMQPPPPDIIKNDVVLLIDTSSSMTGHKIKEVKDATAKFITSRNLSDSSNDRLSLVEFGNKIRVVVPLTSNAAALQTEVNSLNVGNGTPMAEGLQEAIKALNTSQNDFPKEISNGGKVSYFKHILLFTDGVPADATTALAQATLVRNSNIQLVAIGTGDAKVDFLAKMTGDDKKVFFAQQGKFDDMFKKAEEVIFPNTFINSNKAQNTKKTSSNLTLEITQTAVWSAILAIGIGLFLIVGQNYYLHRPLFALKELLIGIGGSVLVGLFSGAMGQLFYAWLIGILTSPLLIDATKVSAWIILGLLLGFGMSFFIPNLKKGLASLGGAIGGLIGVIMFLLLITFFGETSGRVLGAVMVGFFIGLMIALAELAREAYLEVRWGLKDKSVIVLGNRPITIGSSKASDIYLPEKIGAPSEFGEVTFQKGTVTFYNKQSNQKQILQNGSKFKVADIEIEVKIHG